VRELADLHHPDYAWAFDESAPPPAESPIRQGLDANVRRLMEAEGIGYVAAYQRLIERPELLEPGPAHQPPSDDQTFDRAPERCETCGLYHEIAT
jgi:hypothetical protein